MWVQEDGAQGRDREQYLGLSSRGEGFPAGPGLTNVTVGRTGTLGWLVMPYQTSTPAGLGGVTLAFERRAVKKPQASQEQVVQHPSLNVPSGLHAPFLYLHVPVYTLSSRPNPAVHCLEGPHVERENTFPFTRSPIKPPLVSVLGKLSDSGDVMHIALF